MNSKTQAPDAASETLSKRDLRRLTAHLEKRLLIAIARRLPAWVTPDHLTALGAIAMAGAGLCYRLVALSPLALLGVNLCLFVNWFGDSLDGTVARVRDRQRPRYGFYLDHVVDALGAIALLGGFAASGLVSPFAGLSLLIAYLLLQVHIALKAHTTRVFQIAFGGIGGTEARLLLSLANLVMMAWPEATILPTLVAWISAAALLAVVLVDGAKTARALDLEERGAWR